MRFPPCADLACCKFYLKFAVTAVSLVMVTEQVVESPVHAPPQPTHGDPAAGVALSVTTVPVA